MMNPGQLVMLVSPKGKRYFRLFEPGATLNTHDGTITFPHAKEFNFGQKLITHIQREYQVLQPTLYDLVKSLKRSTQIIYPKEIGYILLKLGVGPGKRIIEAGSGSGSLTMALAWYIGEQGMVHTYERRQEFADLCLENLRTVGLEDRVTSYVKDIADGFEQRDGEALFLDVRTPWEYLEQVQEAVVPGAPVGFLLPTTNQVSALLDGLQATSFSSVEVLEILLRRYKPVSDRLRPDDRMVAHTGYLIFARNGGC